VENSSSTLETQDQSLVRAGEQEEQDQIKKAVMRGAVGLLVLMEKEVALRLPPLPPLLGDPCLQCPLTCVQVPHRQMAGEELELRGRKGVCGALEAKVTRQGGVGEMMVAQIPQWYLRERGKKAVQQQSGVAQREV